MLSQAGCDFQLTQPLFNRLAQPPALRHPAKLGWWDLVLARTQQPLGQTWTGMTFLRHQARLAATLLFWGSQALCPRAHATNTPELLGAGHT